MNSRQSPNGLPTIRQHTLLQSMTWRAGCNRRNSDVLRLHPAAADSGIQFVSHGTAALPNMIPTRWEAVLKTRQGPALTNSDGVTIHGVVPLLAALRMAGVDNAVVEVKSCKIPATADDVIALLAAIADTGLQALTQARRLLCVLNPIEVRDNLGMVRVSPANDFRAQIHVSTGPFSGTTSATLFSRFAEPPSGTAEPASEPNTEMKESHERTMPLRELGTLPEVLRPTAIALLGHLALTGYPVAASAHLEDANPGHYLALLHAMMERRAAVLTTVDARGDRLLGPTNTTADPLPS